MTRILLSLLVSLLAFPLLASDPPKRPKIIGIASLHFYSTKLATARAFYAKILDPELTCVMCEEHVLDPFTVYPSIGQSVLFTKPDGDPPTNLLVEITFSTDNLKAMRKYLEANGVQILRPRSADDSSFAVNDPEGHRVRFVQYQVIVSSSINPNPHHIIHAGFIVKDRAAEDKFYKDILGFRPYWHGGMKDDETTWVSQQVPDGSDWLEYMLYDDSKADKHFRGVMNHIALGVKDIQATKTQLLKNGVTLTEEPKLGRDGKWQLNVYDPDETRVEFMEFTPSRPPCCSDFTAPHPKP
jgi:catechol 2,3-dioxygenase-like lactoylglutathione lyase family enzyme